MDRLKNIDGNEINHANNSQQRGILATKYGMAFYSSLYNLNTD